MEGAVTNCFGQGGAPRKWIHFSISQPGLRVGKFCQPAAHRENDSPCRWANLGVPGRRNQMYPWPKFLVLLNLVSQSLIAGVSRECHRETLPCSSLPTASKLVLPLTPFPFTDFRPSFLFPFSFFPEPAIIPIVPS